MGEVHFCACGHVQHRGRCYVQMPEPCGCKAFEYAGTHPDENALLVEDLRLPADYGIAQ